jgi:periplasmic protein TonB
MGKNIAHYSAGIVTESINTRLRRGESFMQRKFSEVFNVSRATAVSLLLHLFCILLFIAPLAAHVRHQQLQVEMVGVVSDRQIAGQMKGELGVPQSSGGGDGRQKKGKDPAPKKTEKPQIQQPKIKMQEQATGLESPIPATERTENTASGAAQNGTGPSSAFSAGHAGRPGGKTDQIQQTLGLGGHPPDANSAIRDYIAWVARQVNSHLIYPKDMRKHGIEGVCRVRFTITSSGGIEGGSLKVQRSSGHASFDSSALKTVAMCAPFKNPPKELTLSLDIMFTTDRM